MTEHLAIMIAVMVILVIAVLIWGWDRFWSDRSDDDAMFFDSLKPRSPEQITREEPSNEHE